MKNDEKITAVIEEAARILRDYPHLKYYEAVIKAKEVLKDESNIREFNGSDNTRTSNVDV